MLQKKARARRTRPVRRSQDGTRSRSPVRMPVMVLRAYMRDTSHAPNGKPGARTNPATGLGGRLIVVGHRFRRQEVNVLPCGEGKRLPSGVYRGCDRRLHESLNAPTGECSRHASAFTLAPRRHLFKAIVSMTFQAAIEVFVLTNSAPESVHARPSTSNLLAKLVIKNRIVILDLILKPPHNPPSPTSGTWGLPALPLGKTNRIHAVDRAIPGTNPIQSPSRAPSHFA